MWILPEFRDAAVRSCRREEGELAVQDGSKVFAGPRLRKLWHDATRTWFRALAYLDLTVQVGGPMWLGPIQDHQFAERCLKSIKGQEGDYATWTRMHGMLLCAREVRDFHCCEITLTARSSTACSTLHVTKSHLSSAAALRQR